ncbi:MAG: hypothetical protein JNM24_16195 [Bdellovibrionaceae bacterium]|nr:hypothetical protein [Pseudobdellovibrionaceae bacterium]
MLGFNNSAFIAPILNFSVLQLGGDLSKKQNHLENALGYYRAAEVAAGDNSFQKKVALGEQIKLLCGRINKCTDAVPSIEKLLIVDGNHPWTLNNMAVWYKEMGNNMKAIELLRKALAITSFGAAKTNLVSSIVAEARLRMKNRQPSSVNEDKKIEDLLVEAYKQNPRDFELLHIFVEYHLELAKQKPDAIKLAKNYLDEMKTAENGNIFRYFELEKQYKIAAETKK